MDRKLFQLYSAKSIHLDATGSYQMKALYQLSWQNCTNHKTQSCVITFQAIFQNIAILRTPTSGLPDLCVLCVSSFQNMSFNICFKIFQNFMSFRKSFPEIMSVLCLIQITVTGSSIKMHVTGGEGESRESLRKMTRFSIESPYTVQNSGHYPELMPQNSHFS